MSDLLVTTSSEIAGTRIVQTVGLARGNSIRARHVGKDILAGFRSIVGGEIHEYAKLLAESREQALDRMCDQARVLGANAVVDMRFTTSVVLSGAAEMLAYGTAVIVEDVPA